MFVSVGVPEVLCLSLLASREFYACSVWCPGSFMLVPACVPQFLCLFLLAGVLLLKHILLGSGIGHVTLVCVLLISDE